MWIEHQENPVLGNRPRRWNLRKANWVDFQSSLETALLTRAETYAMSAEEFTSLLLNSADGCIPKTSGQPRRTPVPWWTKECGDAIRARKRAFKLFDRRSTTENLIAFKRARAFARRTIREAKAVSWRNYVTSLNRFTPTTEVWSRIKRISGRYSSVPLPVLKVNDSDITHPSEVAEAIGRSLAERCRGGNTHPQVTRRRARRELAANKDSELVKFNYIYPNEFKRSSVKQLT